MNPIVIGVLGLVVLLVFLFAGMRIGIAMALVGFLGILTAMADSSDAAIQRVGFGMQEFAKVEFPNLMKAVIHGITLFKPLTEYNDQEINYVAGILTRIVVFFHTLFGFLKNLFTK